MAYSTQADLEKSLTPAQLVQLTDDDRDGVPDAAVITEAIAQADGIIDSYLATRYTVPLSPVQVVIRAASVSLAIWKIYGRRTILNEAVTEQYKATIAFLKALAEGKATLGVTPAPTASEEGGPAASREEDDRIFTIKKDDVGGSLDNF